MARRLPVVVALNKIDRGDARPAEVLDAVYELFIDLGADEHQIEFPVLYTNAKAGTATDDPTSPAPTSARCSTSSSRVTPPPTYQPDHPLQLLVTNLVRQRLRGPDGGRAALERAASASASASRSSAKRPTTPPARSSPAGP